MREIEFRGVCNVRNIWAYGSLCDTNEGLLIVRDVHHIDGQDYCLECSDVIPETVGQFTGLTDKNGVKIYEGDKVEFEEPFAFAKMRGNVIFENCAFHIQTEDFECYLDSAPDIEVIGNIHEKQGD